MNNKGFVGMIGLLLTVVIISFVAYFAFTQYFGKPTKQMDQSTQKMVTEAGIDPTSQQAILESTKARLKGLEQLQQQSADQTLNIINQ